MKKILLLILVISLAASCAYACAEVHQSDTGKVTIAQEMMGNYIESTKDITASIGARVWKFMHEAFATVNQRPEDKVRIRLAYRCSILGYEIKLELAF